MFRKISSLFAVVALALGIGAALLSPSEAKAFSETTYTNAITIGSTNLISATTTNTLTNQVFAVRPGYGVGLFLTTTNAGATTSNINVKVQGSPDGTNWTTIPIFNWSVAQNGTSTVSAYTNISGLQIDSLRAIKVDTVENAAAGAARVTLTVSRGVPTAPK
jgi:hypothetical protein